MTAVDRHVVSIVGVLDVILTIVSRQICCQASVVISQSVRLNMCTVHMHTHAQLHTRTLYDDVVIVAVILCE